MGEILEIARRHRVAVVEDAAHAFPLRLPEGAAGTLGDAGAFSLYATKTITSGEGGMVVAREESVLRRIETMRLHGFDRAAWDRYTSKTASWRYDVVAAGYKCNLPDLLAAVGREQLKKGGPLPGSAAGHRRALPRRLRRPSGARVSPRPSRPCLAPVQPEDQAQSLRIGRDEFAERLQRAGIGVSVHFIPLHLMSYWSRRYALSPEDFPEAYAKYSRTISLPIWQGMTGAQVDRVASAVRDRRRGAVLSDRRRDAAERSFASVTDFKVDGMLYVAAVARPRPAARSARSASPPFLPGTAPSSPRTYRGGTPWSRSAPRCRSWRRTESPT